MICCLNGKFIDINDAKISVMDHGFLYSDGFYDTMKSFDGTILDLELHLARIEKSLKTLKITLPWSLKTVSTWIKKTVKLNPLKLARVRLTITRGTNNFDFFTSPKPTLVITTEPIVIDPMVYKKGMTAFSIPLQRVLPEIKTIGVTSMILARRNTLAKGGQEALFIDEKGFVTEGSITNIFIIKKDILYTPKDRILPGITRHEIIQIARANSLKVIENKIKLGELLKADEAFLSNTKFGIISLVKVDQKKIGNGKTGNITKKIMKLFEEYIATYLAVHEKQRIL